MAPTEGGAPRNSLPGGQASHKGGWVPSGAPGLGQLGESKAKRGAGSNTWCHFTVGGKLGGACSPAPHAAGRGEAAGSHDEDKFKVASPKYMSPALSPISRRKLIPSDNYDLESGSAASGSRRSRGSSRGTTSSTRRPSSDPGGCRSLKRVGSAMVVLSAGVPSGYP
eukprot:CAMPEP_0197912594 /NCGR_PEP_ID=MMETSP1439-20131203/75079_1 /TAXON_ID=66791 /ORGANISM="Gonyaulax spinifera, Strain CCMP409" /LENGTH=166 /DNA_ID=CAMNT_0043534395 /DNA_START=51 /DNA_END=547 /DNA_ORIENTATION=+